MRTIRGFAGQLAGWMFLLSVTIVFMGWPSSCPGQNQSQPSATKPKARYANVTRFAITRHTGEGMIGVGMINGFSISSTDFRRQTTSAFGIGIEYERCKIAEAIPIFLDVMMMVDIDRVSPLVFFDIGYSYMHFVDLSEKNLGGSFINGGAGAKIKSMNEKISFLIELGYKNQKTAGVTYNSSSYRGHNYGVYYYAYGNANTSLSFFTLSVGLAF